MSTNAIETAVSEDFTEAVATALANAVLADDGHVELTEMAISRAASSIASTICARHRDRIVAEAAAILADNLLAQASKGERQC